MAAQTATISAGQEINATKQLSSEDLSKGRTYVYVTQLFVGMFEGFILIAIIMTWIYHFTTSKALVLISLFHIPLLGTFILSVAVIPIYWKFWTKSQQKGGGGVKHGQRLILAYIFLQTFNIAASVSSLAWRIVLFRAGCAATILVDECLNDGFRTVEVAFLTIDAAAALFAIIGMIMGIIIRAYLGMVAGRSVKVTKLFTDSKGGVTGFETNAEGKRHANRAYANANNTSIRNRTIASAGYSVENPPPLPSSTPIAAHASLTSQSQVYGNDEKTIAFKFN